MHLTTHQSHLYRIVCARLDITDYNNCRWRMKVLLDHETANECSKIVTIFLGRKSLRHLRHVEHNAYTWAILAEHRLIRPTLTRYGIFRWRCAQRRLRASTIATLFARRRKAGLLQRFDAGLVVAAFVHAFTIFRCQEAVGQATPEIRAARHVILADARVA